MTLKALKVIINGAVRYGIHQLLVLLCMETVSHDSRFFRVSLVMKGRVQLSTSRLSMHVSRRVTFQERRFLEIAVKELDKTSRSK